MDQCLKVGIATITNFEPMCNNGKCWIIDVGLFMFSVGSVQSEKFRPFEIEQAKDKPGNFISIHLTGRIWKKRCKQR